MHAYPYRYAIHYTHRMKKLYEKLICQYCHTCASVFRSFLACVCVCIFSSPLHLSSLPLPTLLKSSFVRTALQYPFFSLFILIFHITFYWLSWYSSCCLMRRFTLLFRYTIFLVLLLDFMCSFTKCVGKKYHYLLTWNYAVSFVFIIRSMEMVCHECKCSWWIK